MQIVAELEPVEVLKFPYPYQAAFAVASDIDDGSIGRFRAVHALFCGHGVIREGSAEWRTLGLTTNCSSYDKDSGGVPGLGLECGDSFFLIGDGTTFGMHRYVPDEDRFVEDEQEGENCAALVRHWIKEGAIDSYHTFLHYTRRQVEPLLQEFYDWCEGEDVTKPRVWINHSRSASPSGLCPAKLHPNRLERLARLAARKIVGPCFGRERVPLRHALVRYQGDTPGSPHYINDLLAANGLRYVWLNRADTYRNRIALPEQQQNGRAAILQPVTMDDGVLYWRFERCYGALPGRGQGEICLHDSKDGFDASHLITEANLRELCRSNGTCILCTHWTHPCSVPIADETIGRFALLRRWQDAGRIWVTSTARLLEWTRRRTFLKVVCHREGRRLVVEVEGVDDPIFGRESLHLHDLQGLCLRLHPSEADITVAVGGDAMSPNQVHHLGQLCWLDVGNTRNLPHHPQGGRLGVGPGTGG